MNTARSLTPSRVTTIPAPGSERDTERAPSPYAIEGVSGVFLPKEIHGVTLEFDPAIHAQRVENAMLDWQAGGRSRSVQVFGMPDGGTSVTFTRFGQIVARSSKADRTDAIASCLQQVIDR